MHVWTHLKPASEGKTKLGVYPDGMVELDGLVGQLLKKLDDLGIADNTIVLFTTDNGAEVMSWPDGGATPFRGEKATNWEGAFRVPMVIRWPGTIKPGSIYNEMCSHYDLIPTFAAAGGDPDIVEKCMRGAHIGNKTFKVHLDGFNLIPFFKGEAREPPRKEFVYWNDDGQLVAIRVNDWKSVFLEQDNKGIGVWSGQFTDLRIPKLFNLRSDPFERGGRVPSSTTNGWRTAPSSRCRCRRSPPNGCRASRTIRCGSEATRGGIIIVFDASLGVSGCHRKIDARRHQGARPARNAVERHRRPRAQSPKYPARLVCTGGDSDDDLQRAGASPESDAGCCSSDICRSFRTQAEHSGDLGRRYRHRQHQRLLEWADGL